MRNKLLVFGNLELTKEEEEYFDLQEQVSDLLIEIIGRRMDLNMSQRDLALKCGIKQPMIARIERMDATPRIDTLIKICNSLGLRIVIEKDTKKEKVITNDNVIIYNGKAIQQKQYHINEDQIKLKKKK